VDEPPPGFVVERVDIPEALGREDAGVRIATSRHGQAVSVSRLATLAGRLEGDVTVAFGSPERGLPEILDVAVEDVTAHAPRWDVDDTAEVEPGPAGFDLWLNTIPRQGSEVVRTEEAMFASLATLTLTE
jgi:hypothetical protein